MRGKLLKSAGGPKQLSLQSRSLGTAVAFAVWLTLIASAFPPYPSCLYSLSLLVSGWGETEARHLCGAPKVWENY